MSLVAELAKGKDRLAAVQAVGTAAAYASGGRGTPDGRSNQAGPAELPEKLKPFVNMVIDALTDKDPEVQYAAIGGLYDMGPAVNDAVPASVLVALLGHVKVPTRNPDDLIVSILERLARRR